MLKAVGLGDCKDCVCNYKRQRGRVKDKLCDFAVWYINFFAFVKEKGGRRE